jgi:hypothetical protein
MCVLAVLWVIGELPLAVFDSSSGVAPAGAGEISDVVPQVAEPALSRADGSPAENSGSANSTRSNASYGVGKNQVVDTRFDKDDPSRIVANSRGRAESTRPVKDDDLAMPVWHKIFNPDGSAIDVVGRKGKAGTNGVPDYLELYQAFDAGYMEEVISNGIATDMSALLMARDVSDEVLYNGAVSAAHDLGNAFYLLTVAPSGSLRLYFGVERLRSDLPTFIEFELNQNRIHVTSGTPWWNIQGSRRDGDLLVRFNLMAGNLASVELAEWRNGGYFIFESDIQGLGQGCRDRFSYIYCVGPPPLDRSNQSIEVWDKDYVPVEATLADSFVELGLDVDRLLGSGSEFSGLYIRTPEDVVLTSFRGIGTFAVSSVGSP